MAKTVTRPFVHFLSHLSKTATLLCTERPKSITLSELPVGTLIEIFSFLCAPDFHYGVFSIDNPGEDPYGLQMAKFPKDACNLFRAIPGLYHGLKVESTFQRYWNFGVRGSLLEFLEDRTEVMKRDRAKCIVAQWQYAIAEHDFQTAEFFSSHMFQRALRPFQKSFCVLEKKKKQIRSFPPGYCLRNRN